MCGQTATNLITTAQADVSLCSTKRWGIERKCFFLSGSEGSASARVILIASLPPHKRMLHWRSVKRQEFGTVFSYLNRYATSAITKYLNNCK